MNDFLLGAADESSGGAVERSRWRPDRIVSRRAMNLLATAGGSAGVALVFMNLFFGPSPTATGDEYSYTSDAYASPMPSGAAQPAVAPVTAPPDWAAASSASAPLRPSGNFAVEPSALQPTDTRTYAVSMAELHGLSEDASPGTVLELWVMWSDAATDEPKLQRLIKSATLEKIAPAIVEGASPVAILRVATKDVPDLIWGDQYGTLSAVMRPTG